MGRESTDGSPTPKLGAGRCGSPAITSGFGNYVRSIYSYFKIRGVTVLTVGIRATFLFFLSLFSNPFD